MRTRLMFASAMSVALLAGAAYAQSASAQGGGDTAVNPPSSSSSSQSSSGASGAKSPGLNGSDAASVAPAAGAPTERTESGRTLITNGPVPDTPEIRAKYGKPLSAAGRRTKPKGN